jgi:hypothetical protein
MIVDEVEKGNLSYRQAQEKYGNILQDIGLQIFEINTKDLNSGIYYYRIIADGELANGTMAIVK